MKTTVSVIDFTLLTELVSAVLQERIFSTTEVLSSLLDIYLVLYCFFCVKANKRQNNTIDATCKQTWNHFIWSHDKKVNCFCCHLQWQMKYISQGWTFSFWFRHFVTFAERHGLLCICMCVHAHANHVVTQRKSSAFLKHEVWLPCLVCLI